MSKVCAIFIDGGYLKAILKNNNNFSLDYFELSNKISKIINAERLRTYYYDCLPALIEHNEKSKKLFQDKEKFLEKINSLPRFEIKLGKLQRIGNTFRQKKIDVLMSLDIVDKCFEKQIQHAVLIAGDADFIPAIKKEISVPLIAAGGIASGSAMMAAMLLGADGVQMGSRFVASIESSAHENFKNTVVQTKEGETHLTLKEITPVRLIKNSFYKKVQHAYENGASIENLKTLLGRGRAKKGMFEGDLEEGELEIGQVSAMINEIKPVSEIIEEIMSGYSKAKEDIQSDKFKF